MGRPLQKIKYDLNGETVTVQVFARDEDGTVDGYCFSRGLYIRDPYGEPREAKDIPAPKEKTPEEINAEIAEVSSYQVLPLDDRKLSAEALDDFGVKVAVSESDGKTPELVYYPYHKKGKL